MVRELNKDDHLGNQMRHQKLSPEWAGNLDLIDEEPDSRLRFFTHSIRNQSNLNLVLNGRAEAGFFSDPGLYSILAHGKAPDLRTYGVLAKQCLRAIRPRSNHNPRDVKGWRERPEHLPLGANRCTEATDDPHSWAQKAPKGARLSLRANPS